MVAALTSSSIINICLTMLEYLTHFHLRWKSRFCSWKCASFITGHIHAFCRFSQCPKRKRSTPKANNKASSTLDAHNAAVEIEDNWATWPTNMRQASIGKGGKNHYVVSEEPVPQAEGLRGTNHSHNVGKVARKWQKLALTPKGSKWFFSSSIFSAAYTPSFTTLLFSLETCGKPSQSLASFYISWPEIGRIACKIKNVNLILFQVL